MQDYYEKLGLNPGMSLDEIKDELARKENKWTARNEGSTVKKAGEMLALLNRAKEVFEKALGFQDSARPDTVVQFVKRNIGKKGAAVQFTAPSGKTYTPEMISSLILQKVCRDAEKYAGEDEVITVPVYFDDARRTATKQAGMLTGQNVLDILNEPTAAAIFASTVSKRPENRETGSAAAEEGEMPAGGLIISDVTSQSLGIVSIDPADPAGKKEVNSVIIPNNTAIPAKRSREFRTVVENQTSVKIQVTEGNDPELEYVNIIGETVLQIPPYPKGSPIEVVFAYDANQIVYVEVIDLVAGKSMGTFDIERRSNLTAEQLVQAEETVRQTSVE